MEFVRGVKRTRDGVVWFCQNAGSRWATESGWELYYTEGPSWWLFGPAPYYGETDMGTTKVTEAFVTAVPYVLGQKKAGEY